ncbi:MAG: hypothetical protein A4E32_01137 [Methanomassiliicoccales archaeon PtaU1.Bin124]|nr:MAG: hypothetical protein A4E32_01137 [Methanomassiliicoccales archaeon PtaU1.Bin124]
MRTVTTMDGYGKFCPICGMPIAPQGMLTACVAHGTIMYLEEAMADQGDVTCKGCGNTVRKRYVHCPYCNKLVEESLKE